MTVNIIGIGCVSALGNSAEEVWNNLQENHDELIKFNCPYEFESPLKGAIKRRASRHANISVSAMVSAIRDADFEGKTESSRIGTIYSTDYGSLDTNLKFAEQVLNGDPDMCSPSLFSNTVANSSLGTLCILGGYKGVSTMLIESNNIGYSKNLIDEGRADYIFSGFVSEFNFDLFESYKALNKSKENCFAECAVTFIMTNSETKENVNAYCKVDGFCEVNIGCNPLSEIGNEDVTRTLIERCMNVSLKNSGFSRVDAVILAGEGLLLEEIEKLAINSISPNAYVLSGIKKKIGETCGCNFNAAAMIAALCLKKNEIPKSLCVGNEKRQVKSILVNGYSRMGNYISAVFSK